MYWTGDCAGGVYCVGGVNMAINSKRKGKRGEREFAKLCREYGYDARRSQQYAGGVDSADVIGLPGIHVEVKLRNTITEGDKAVFIRQAIRDAAGSEKIPIVAHKEKYRQWLVTMTMFDFARMYMRILGNLDTPPDEHIVTMTADAWFTVYREYEATLSMQQRKAEIFDGQEWD